MSTSTHRPASSALGLGWRLLAWPIAWAGWLVVRALAATWRFEPVAGRAEVEALLREPRPVLLCAWHRSLLPICAWVLSGPLRGRLPVTFLVSRSRDGELVSRLLRLWGARVVRGSSSRGGREALRALYRAVRREGSSVLALPDGPRGPERRFKPGTLVLAQTTGAPVLPLACRVSSCWRLRSWDRLIVPKPFARVRVAVGVAHAVPRELGSEGQAAELGRLEGLLDALEAGLGGEAGREPS